MWSCFCKQHSHTSTKAHFRCVTYKGSNSIIFTATSLLKEGHYKRICSSRNKFFPFIVHVDPTWKGYIFQESEQEVIKVGPLPNKWQKNMEPHPFTLKFYTACKPFLPCQKIPLMMSKLVHTLSQMNPSWKISKLKCTGTPPCFSVIFTKEKDSCDFLFTSPYNIALPKWGLLLKENISSCRSKSFLLTIQPFQSGVYS